MAFEYFVYLVAVLAIVYALIVFYAQNKLIDKKEVEQIQKEQQLTNEELKQAQKSGNKKRIDDAMQKQMDFLPKMNKMMMGQLKVMGVILIIFFGFTSLVEYINPAIKDDLKFSLLDDGKRCDRIANDSIYSGCFEITESDQNRWIAKANVYYEDNGLLGVTKKEAYNSTEIYYLKELPEDPLREPPGGELSIPISTDRKTYQKGETVRMYVKAPDNEKIERIDATIDSGTGFFVELPIAIPFKNEKRIYQGYWWFILVSVITNICISLAAKRTRWVKK